MRLQRNINQAILFGTVIDSPTIRTTSSGFLSCSFRLCTFRSFKTSSGEQKEEVEFHMIVAWDKLAEICSKVIEKGSKVYVQGRIRTNKIIEPEGMVKYSTEIAAYDVVVAARPDDAKRDDLEIDKMINDGGPQRA
jgi:single-strand DNA-binding protein